MMMSREKGTEGIKHACLIPSVPFSFACLLAWSLSSMANAQVQRTNDYLSKMDADRDGRVSLAEYQDWLGYAFHGMDRDRDGVLSAAEQPSGRGAPLTLAEHRARIAARFAKQDANRDGFLSAKELAAPPQ
jgi:Ca2+-binding EF-hand superfamily protein